MKMKGIRNFSSAFSKGRLTLSKLRDKATIDDEISHVNLVFPDQYGRLTGLKLSADHFLNEVERGPGRMFEYKQNPFRFDVSGSEIINFFGVKMPESLLLQPDMQTLREVQPHEAMVMADVHSEEMRVVPYAPRNAIKQLLPSEITT